MHNNEQIQLAVWGGVEASQVSVERECVAPQLDLTGHSSMDRVVSDIQRFKELGIKTLRQPILMERIASGDIRDANWEWSDLALQTLADVGIQPIAGLLHHGSGPLHTDLTDPLFPWKVASYAGEVAKRYPHIDAYTITNEILTTARFSGLNGFWYPHHRSELSFFQAVFNQCLATVLSMVEIRKINPSAKLVTTEDMGVTYATPTMQYQADFENQRQLLSLDILTGKFTEDHPLWEFAQNFVGIHPDRLKMVRDMIGNSGISPDIMGANWYVTSDRFLDERITAYPSELVVSNDIHQYVNTEAARVHGVRITGFYQILKFMYARYCKPVAITELHLGCEEIEESVRWWAQGYAEAIKALLEGIPVMGVTAWALLGLVGWSKLLTKRNGDYERAVFDISSGTVEPTLVAALIKEIANGAITDPVLIKILQQSGWWERADGVLYYPELVSPITLHYDTTVDAT